MIGRSSVAMLPCTAAISSTPSMFGISRSVISTE
jgi:hypothetical protein